MSHSFTCSWNVQNSNRRRFLSFFTGFGNHIIRPRGKVREVDESYEVGIPYDRRGSACEVTLENDEHDTTRTVAAPLPTVAAVVL